MPAGIADRWELLDKDVVDREELGQEPDGARRFRISFAAAGRRQGVAALSISPAALARPGRQDRA